RAGRRCACLCRLSAHALCRPRARALVAPGAAPLAAGPGGAARAGRRSRAGAAHSGDRGGAAMPLVAKGLVHAYPGASAPVLNGLSLDLVPGHVLAFCGAARTGRRLAVALLAWLRAPREGVVV